jgi:hypothetical protein
LRTVFFRSDFGVGFARPSDDGGFEEFFEFCDSRALLCDLGPQRLDLRPQHADLSILGPATSRSRILAARSVASSSGAEEASRTGHT